MHENASPNSAAPRAHHSKPERRKEDGELCRVEVDHEVDEREEKRLQKQNVERHWSAKKTGLPLRIKMVEQACLDKSSKERFFGDRDHDEMSARQREKLIRKRELKWASGLVPKIETRGEWNKDDRRDAKRDKELSKKGGERASHCPCKLKKSEGTRRETVALIGVEHTAKLDPEMRKPIWQRPRFAKGEPQKERADRKMRIV